MDAARVIVALLILRQRAAAKNVARATSDKLHSALLTIFEAQHIEARDALKVARDIYRASRGGEKWQRRHVIRTTEQRDEFVMLEDGYLHYWPQGSPHGALASWHLRVLADELDRRNHAWDSHLRKVFSRQ